MNEFGQLLEQMRRLKGLTLHEMAKKTGKVVDYLRDIEQGRKPIPSPDVISMLERALNIENLVLQKTAQEYRERFYGKTNFKRLKYANLGNFEIECPRCAIPMPFPFYDVIARQGEKTFDCCKCYCKFYLECGYVAKVAI